MDFELVRVSQKEPNFISSNIPKRAEKSRMLPSSNQFIYMNPPKVATISAKEEVVVNFNKMDKLSQVPKAPFYQYPNHIPDHLALQMMVFQN